MVKLAIIGLGPVWESRYRPVLEKLRHRIRICGVYDAVASRCEQAALDLRATPFQGVVSLLAQPEIRGVLLFDMSWHGKELLHFLRLARKPAYIAGSLGEDRDELIRLRALVETDGLVVMPEFSRRFTPATCRLHELIATRLGRPRHVAIEAVQPAEDASDVIPGQSAGTDFLVGLLDWCRYVIRSSAIRVESGRVAPAQPDQASVHHIRVEFAETRGPGWRPTAELRLHGPEPCSGRNAASPAISFTVQCEQGEAVIEGPAQIRWTVAGHPQVVESLTADRSEVEVMIDHFCRRVVGGLVPIADITDVCHCVKLVRATAESLAMQTPVELNGDLV